MKTWVWVWICCVAAMATAGCSNRATSAADRHFLLPYSPSEPTVASDAAKLLVNIDLASHLSQPGLVFRSSDTEVVEAVHHLWAHSVREQIKAQLVASLRAKQTQFWILAMNPLLKLAQQPQLHVRFTQFNGAVTGEAELAGEWMLISARGEIQQTHYFQHRIPLEKDGYPALVAALAQGLDELAAAIAVQL